MMLSHIMLRNWFVELICKCGSIQMFYNHLMSVEHMITAVYQYCFANLVLTFRIPPDHFHVTGRIVIAQKCKTTKIKKWISFLFVCFLQLYYGIRFNNEWNQPTNQVIRDALQGKVDDLIKAFMAEKKNKEKPRRMGIWGSDSTPIVIDTATTRTITPRFEDLIDPVEYQIGLEGI